MSTATISAQDINKLRQATGAGMMDCRKALTETNGDFEAAIDWLRKQGQKVAAKRSDREAKEGVVIAQTTADNKTGIVVCVSCETDFVSKNADFVAFGQTIADAAIANNVKTLEELMNTAAGNSTVAELVNDKLATIGEKIGVTKFERVDAAYVASYNHGAYRIGVLVGMDKEAVDAGKDVAMQIAALNPVAVDAASVSADIIAREKDIILELMKQDPKMAGKPEEMLSKIVEGKMGAFFKEQTLTAQSFVKDGSKTVADFLKESGDVKVTEFKRVALG
ncbi:MAG: elongation factor Ts [Chitinophagaceae bacterium]|nr:elongation factor Ts [Chitinophagaceae bacterium]MBK8608154.1 elongation factor Ts [Chitinophagaceae bacterium]MBP6478504.1 elongation factor Ts [Chitinophagaceae bacterium]MBP7107307.1 elongation factor Ts [Chitinophagaceae bacterium]MBP7315962.1 elongation factor Ts [Chitinophagaceae bacterium]